MLLVFDEKVTVEDLMRNLKMEKYDVIILGAGRSTIIADRLAKAGKKVALVAVSYTHLTLPTTPYV